MTSHSARPDAPPAPEKRTLAFPEARLLSPREFAAALARAHLFAAAPVHPDADPESVCARTFMLDPHLREVTIDLSTCGLLDLSDLLTLGLTIRHLAEAHVTVRILWPSARSSRSRHFYVALEGLRFADLS